MVNEVDIVPEEMPTKEDTTFMIAPPQSAEGVAQGGGVEDSLVVFCIDVSGSMCVSTEVSVGLCESGGGAFVVFV